jgi:hypothetical protein
MEQKDLNETVGYQEFQQLLLEATTTVERELAIEDRGWINLTGGGYDPITPSLRPVYIKQSRLYHARDPLAAQAIRIWTDYTFGPGMTWEVDETNKKTKDILETFWYSRSNTPILGSRGQRKCSQKLLVDGEVFFAIFLGPESTIRTIDPLEITEIVTDPEDLEKPMFYRRSWSDAQSRPHIDYYRSIFNIKGDPTKNALGQTISKTSEAIVYHLAYNTTSQRGNPLLLPALDWIKQYRRFLAARVGMMLARSRFAWRKPVKGGAAAVSTVKGALQDKTPEAGAVLVENEAVGMEAIQTPQDARNAYDDARMLKLQVCAAVGIPEQYFGDIACSSEDTEVLTEKGWMLHQDWKAVNKVASYNPEKKEIEYVEPVMLRQYEYQGNMVHFQHNQMDILVTPNHRMWAARNVPYKPIIEDGFRKVDRSWQFIEAQHIVDNPRAAGWKFVNTANLSEKESEISQSQAKFLGYWLSEGYTLNGGKKKVLDKRDGRQYNRIFYRIAISQKPGIVLNKMKCLLGRMGYKYHSQTNQAGVISLTIVNKALWTWLRTECGTNSHDKRIPREYLQADKSARKALLSALLEGDGGNANGQGSGGLKYSSVSKQLADGVMELALGLGYATSVYEEHGTYNGQPSSIWRVAIRSQRKGCQVLSKHVKLEPYDGMVYCFALPKNHIYITRHNGKVAIQGNTGNLATAKTVELPMLKMFQSYQSVWGDAYQDIFDLVLEYNKVPEDNWYVDKDFPAIAPEDVFAAAQAIVQMVMAFPEFASAPEVRQQALVTLGINDPAQVLDALAKEAKLDPTISLRKALVEFRRFLEAKKPTQ